MAVSCDSCGMPVGPEDAFCGECGATITQQVEEVTEVSQPSAATPDQEELCPSCEGALTPGESFCPWCGLQVAGTVSAPPPTQGGQAPSGAPPAAAAGAAAAFGQGGSEISERMAGAWSNTLLRAPLIFLAIMTIGFLVPVVSLSVSAGGEFIGSGSLSFTITDITRISVFLFLLLSVALLILLVVHDSSPSHRGWTILVVAGVAFILAVTAIFFTIITLALGAGVDVAVEAAREGADGAEDLFGSSDSDFDSDIPDVNLGLGFGGILFLIGSVGLFVTSLRLYSRDS